MSKTDFLNETSVAKPVGVRKTTRLADAARLFFRRGGFFAFVALLASAPGLAAPTPFGEPAGKVLLVVGGLTAIFFPPGAAFAAAFPFFLAAKLALRLAKTGTLRRRVGADEPVLESLRYFGQTFGAFALGIALFFVSAVLFRGLNAIFPGDFLPKTFARLAFIGGIWLAGALLFAAFELSERRTNLFRALWERRLPALSFAARFVFPYFLAVGLAFSALPKARPRDVWPIFGSWEFATFWALASVVGIFVFFAAGPVEYLAATNRRLNCDHRAPDEKAPEEEPSGETKAETSAPKDAKICSACGASVATNAAFCSNCGGAPPQDAETAAPPIPNGYWRAIRHCLRRAFDFNGRTSRSEFWRGAVPILATGFGAAFLYGFGAFFAWTEILPGANEANLSVAQLFAFLFCVVGWLPTTALLLASTIAGFSALLRRFHDRGRFGWSVFATFVAGGITANAELFSQPTVCRIAAAFAALFAICVVVQTALPGTPGPNRFGPEPDV